MKRRAKNMEENPKICRICRKNSKDYKKAKILKKKKIN